MVNKLPFAGVRMGHRGALYMCKCARSGLCYERLLGWVIANWVDQTRPTALSSTATTNELFSPLFKTAVRRTNGGRCLSSMGPNQGKTSVTLRSLNNTDFSPRPLKYHPVPWLSYYHPRKFHLVLASIGPTNIRAIWRPCCMMITSRLMKRFGFNHNEGELRWHSRTQH